LEGGGLGSGTSMRMKESNEEDRLSEKLEEFHGEYFGWALACCSGQQEDARDVLQSAYLKVLEGRARFGGRSSFRTWMFGVIRLSAFEQRRKSFWTRMLGLGAALGTTSEERGPEATAMANEKIDRVREALAGLSRRQREVLHLVFYHDLSIERAASVLGVATGTARTHYERGKAALRRNLGRWENEPHGR